MAIIAVGVLALVVTTSLLIAARGPSNVESRPVAADRLIAPHLEAADYVDNYAAELPLGTTVTIKEIEDAAIQKGQEVATTTNEVVFTDRAPGLTFHVAYALSQSNGRQALELTTAVHFTSRIGRLYFFFVRPVHRLGLPWLTALTVGRASSIRS